MSKLLTVKEASKELGYSIPHTHRLLKSVTSYPNPSGRGKVYQDTDVTALKSTHPVVKAETVPQLSYSEIGSAGIRHDGGSITEERLSQLRGRKGMILLHEMRMNDPVIAAVFFAVENALRRVTWRMSPGSESPVDKEVSDFIWSCLSDMSLSLDATMQVILTMLEFGMCPAEIILKRRKGLTPGRGLPESEFNDGRIGWRKWAWRPPETLVDGNEFMFDETGGIHGIRQEITDGKRRTVEIPIEKLLLFRTTILTPSGIPIHRAAFKPWWMLNNIEEIEGIGFERDVAGVPIIYMGDETKKSGANSDFEQAKDIVVNLRQDEQAGVVFPYPKLGTAGDGRGILLELVSTSGRRAYDSTKIIDRYSKRIALSMLAQFIVLGMDSVGSFALGRLQADIFSLAISAWATSIAEVINKYAIPRLLRYNNFPGMERLPKIVPSDVGIPDLQEIAYFVNTLVQNSLIDPKDKEVQRYLRQVAHLPPLRDFIDEEEESGGMDIRDPKFLRASRASLVMKRIQQLLSDGLISPEEASVMLADLKDELRDALGMPPDTGLQEISVKPTQNVKPTPVAQPTVIKSKDKQRLEDILASWSRKLDRLEEERLARFARREDKTTEDEEEDA